MVCKSAIRVFVLFLSACVLFACSLIKLELPHQAVSERQDWPVEVRVEDHKLRSVIVYLEKEEGVDDGLDYTLVGIHPVFGRQFLISVRDGKVDEVSTTGFLGRRKVQEILNDLSVGM